VMIRDDVAQNIVKQISQLLFALHTTEEGKVILNGMSTAQFHKASDDSYKPVSEFITEFENDVRIVEIK